MPSNLVLNSQLREQQAKTDQVRADAGLTPQKLAQIIERGAQDYLLGEQRWDPSDVCPVCFTARAKFGACFCPNGDDDSDVLADYLKGRIR